MGIKEQIDETVKVRETFRRGQELANKIRVIFNEGNYTFPEWAIATSAQKSFLTEKMGADYLMIEAHVMTIGVGLAKDKASNG